MWKFFSRMVDHITCPPCESYNFSMFGGLKMSIPLLCWKVLKYAPRKSHVCVEKWTIKASKIQLVLSNYIKHFSLESWFNNCDSVVGACLMAWANFQRSGFVCFDITCLPLKNVSTGILFIFWWLVVFLKMLKKK